MDSNVDDLKQIEKLMINSDSRILSIHDLHLYRPNSNECYGSVHVVLNENLTLIEIEKMNLKNEFKKYIRTKVNY